MNLNGKTINPGELRTQITLKKPTVSTDAGGFQTQTLTTLATVYCRWNNVHGAEVWTADARGAVEPATALLRYRSDLDTTVVVEKGTATYEIVSLDDIQERHEWIEMKVKRVVAG